ncbi:MAG: class I SAM-dependent methyltransferase [Chloroflexi bacterium]|nr:class I SAM-dependent methyltransferase [Chloroflexota bacterium]
MGKKFTPPLAYDFLTPFFDRVVNLLGYGKAFKRMALELSEIKDGEKVLDVGCGSGTLLIEAKTRYPNSDFVGIDPDKKILKFAERKLEQAGVKARLVQGFAQELPFPSASFDLVISTLIFHHLPPSVKKEATRDIYRVLKEKGRFLLADLGQPKNALTKLLLGSRLNPDGWVNMKDNIEGKLPLLLQETGFKVNELEARYRGVQFWLAMK